MTTQSEIKTRYLSNTSKRHYITSIAALNIPSPEGTGDWHFSDSFISHGNFIPEQRIAEIDTLSTSHLLGNFGVFECSAILKKYGASSLPEQVEIYAANHYRAVADMIFDLVKKNQSLLGVVILDDWFPEDVEKLTVYKLLDKLDSGFTSEQRMKINEWKQHTDKQT